MDTFTTPQSLLSDLIASMETVVIAWQLAAIAVCLLGAWLVLRLVLSATMLTGGDREIAPRHPEDIGEEGEQRFVRRPFDRWGGETHAQRTFHDPIERVAPRTRRGAYRDDHPIGVLG